MRVTFNADFSPHVLPRLRPAPVKVKVEGRIATTDGSHPPPLRRLEVKINRNGQLYTKGLPNCTAPTLQSTSSETALARCRPALVGRGKLPRRGQARARDRRRLGRNPRLQQPQRRPPALLLHLFAGPPPSASRWSYRW